jgi:hypothetical protein
MLQDFQQQKHGEVIHPNTTLALYTSPKKRYKLKNIHQSDTRATIEQHIHPESHDHCTSIPSLIVAPLHCHPPSESHANEVGIKEAEGAQNRTHGTQ